MKDFLIEANQFLYRSPESVIIRNLSDNDMKLIEYKRDNYAYRNYFTEGKIVYGHVIITLHESTIWCMQYHGGVTDVCIEKRMAHQIKTIHMKNHGLANNSYPIRGPRENEFMGLVYSNDIFGTLSKFQGQEMIHKNGELYFKMKISGGDTL